MARSPMMNALLRLVRTERAARARGIPVSEYVEMEAEARRLSRRRFLEFSAAGAGFAAAGGVSALAGCSGDDTNPALPPVDAGPDGTLDGSLGDAALGADSATLDSGGGTDADAAGPIADANVQTQIAIVGAGMAGLHCAYRLKKDYGVLAQVYEATSTLGGRIQTDRTTFPEGMHVELGGELIDTGQTTMHALAMELGITLLDYSTLTAPDGGTLDTLLPFFGGQPYSTSQIVTDFAPIGTSIGNSYATLPNGAIPSYSSFDAAGQALDQLSVDAYLTSIGATGWCRDFIELAFLTEFGLESDVNNALNLITYINTPPDPFSLYGASDERFTTATGNHTYIEKLAAGLNAAQITTGSALTKIALASDGRYVLTFVSGATTFQVTADHVVLAIPFTVLRTVDTSGVPFNAVKQKAINELGMGQSSKLMVGFTAKPWRDQGYDGETFTDLPFQSTWETSRLQPGNAGIITCFTGGSVAQLMGTGTPADQQSKFLAEWEQVFPGSTAVASDTVVRAFWPGNPWTKGAYASYLVGQYTTISGAEIERSGNIHFCGEHTSLAYQGFMEGAAATGAAAALEVATDLGLGQTGMWRSRRRQLFIPSSLEAARWGRG